MQLYNIRPHPLYDISVRFGQQLDHIINFEWSFRRVGCPFCDNSDHKTLAYYPAADSPHRLYVCEKCNRYLKVVDLRQASMDTALPAQRVLTVGLDIAAREKGYQ